MCRRDLALVLLAGLALVAPSCSNTASESEGTPAMTEASETPRRVEKTEAEWRELLSPEAFRVAREAGTERPGGEAYENWKQEGVGTYHCTCCDAELFSSREKFDAHCGWPAFYDPSQAKNVKTKTDTSLGMTRVEVLCAVCDAHLGHVFEGEGFNTPTDKRYCINAVSLKFTPDAER